MFSAKPIPWPFHKEKPLSEHNRCPDPEHGFPTMLHIQSGKSHTHVCPTCKTETTVTAPTVTLYNKP